MIRLILPVAFLSLELSISHGALFMGSGSAVINFEIESPFPGFGVAATTNEVAVTVDFEPGAIRFDSMMIPEMHGSVTATANLLDPGTLESKSLTATVSVTTIASLPSPATSAGGLVSEVGGLRFSLPQFVPTGPVQVSGDISVQGPTETVSNSFAFSINYIDFHPYTLDGYVRESSGFPDEINLDYSYGFEAFASFPGLNLPILNTTVDGVPILIAVDRAYVIEGSGDGAFAVVPEPSQTALLLVGLTVLARRRRR